MEDKVIYDSGVIREVLRDVKPYDVQRVGQLLAALRDARVDEVPEFAEKTYWAGRTNHCVHYGYAACVVVNGGAPVAAVLVEKDNMSEERASLVACNSAWDEGRLRPILLEAAREWARSQGRKLVQKRVTVEWVEV